MSRSQIIGKRAASFGIACPRCKAAPGFGCRDRSRSYRRGQLLRNPHRERIEAIGK